MQDDCSCNPVHIPAFRRGLQPAIAVGLVVSNEAARLSSLLPLLQSSGAFDELIVINQASTDASAAVASGIASVVINDTLLTGYSEKSSFTLSAAVGNTTAEWLLVLDADEVPSNEFLAAIPRLAREQVDGFKLNRCTFVSQPGGKARLHENVYKTRFFRRGRALPNQAFGTEFLPSCPKCWRWHNASCAIVHNKTQAEIASDGMRYETVCKQACKRRNVDISTEHPDCWWVSTCARFFDSSTHTSRPARLKASHSARQRKSAQLTDRLQLARQRCVIPARIQQDDRDRLLSRVQQAIAARSSTVKPKILTAGGRFLSEWSGHLVFSINAGRSGSKYLGALWKTMSRTIAVHEEGLTMDSGCGDTMTVPLEATYETRLIKAAWIEELVMNASSRHSVQFYAESNPNFKNTFADVVFNEFAHLNITVVVLQRSWPKIIQSLQKLGWMVRRRDGGKGKDSFTWMPTTFSVNSFGYSYAAHQLAGSNFEHPVRLLTNYLMNVNATAEGLRRLYGKPNFRFIPFTSEELFTRDGALALAKQLGMSATGKTKAAIGKVVDHFKSHVTEEQPETELVKEMRDYIELVRRIS